jgi:hypothetical protein
MALSRSRRPISPTPSRSCSSDSADVQCGLAVRVPSPPAQRSPRLCGGDSHQQALSARPRLAGDRRTAWRFTASPGGGRDRRVQRLLLAPDPRREFPPATLRRRGPDLRTSNSATAERGRALRLRAKEWSDPDADFVGETHVASGSVPPRARARSARLGRERNLLLPSRKCRPGEPRSRLRLAARNAADQSGTLT